ncbi:methyltransferase domain-containing protein [Palleronia pelagia]|uniref:Methyltransferase domain-containing protein n=1 Tax=Palleronia pelagia TaxID=387096 RepID=A0A1H8EW09_9RHOB|nr:SAM-dependent methyltransferase [Palleronia pelagia]SEN23672.1 hypothetical protein SAMN04488011_103121 [Palleronia pelagia]
MTRETRRLTDRDRLQQSRRRTRADALFLHGYAADQLEERLEEVNRTFTAIAVVTGHPEFWSARFPDATIVTDDEVLALERGRHDLVIHAMALHWADDPVGQMAQCRLALQPDGLFLGVCFGGQTLSELRSVLAHAESIVSGGIAPRVLPMAEIRDLGGLIQRAGLALPVADTDPIKVDYADLAALVRDLRHMGEGNAMAARDPRPLPRAVLRQAAQTYAASFPASDDADRIVATFELVFLSGWAPDESQQKPLRPGSAKARLADVLGTDETSLRDDSRRSGD